METLLWALDLALVALFCIWAIREDDNAKHDHMTGNNQIMPDNDGKQTRKSDHA